MAIQELVKLFNTKNYDKGFFLQREVVSLSFLQDSGNISYWPFSSISPPVE